MSIAPRAHQGVLHHRQLICLFANIVEHTIKQACSDLLPEQPDRAFDGLLALLAREAWDEVLAVVHRFGQAVEVVFAEEVRAHRHHDIDRQGALLDERERESRRNRQRPRWAGLPDASKQALFKLVNEYNRFASDAASVGVSRSMTAWVLPTRISSANASTMDSAQRQPPPAAPPPDCAAAHHRFHRRDQPLVTVFGRKPARASGATPHR